MKITVVEQDIIKDSVVLIGMKPEQLRTSADKLLKEIRAPFDAAGAKSVIFLRRDFDGEDY
jgi:hypothetical protein